MRRFFGLSLVVLFVACFLLLPQATDAKDLKVDVLISSPKPYNALVKKIEDVGGAVRFRYKNIDAIAATIPSDKLSEIQSLPKIGAFIRDVTFSLGKPPSLAREGFGHIEARHTINSNELSGDTFIFTEEAPDGYYPTEVNLTHASDFWVDTGHFGENVIVGIMDTGTAEVDAIAGRVLGGESFLTVNPVLDDGLGANSPLNNPHGTWVATTLGANAAFGINPASTFAKSLKLHLPEAIIPDIMPGVDGVPMVGQAPFAQFYALKIFNVNEQTSNSIILAAFDRVIELKDQGIVDIKILNGSFGGPSLFAAEDPFFAGIVKAIQDVGIVTCFSAGNEGPSALTGGDPGLARNNLTIGATNIAAYEKILRDLQYGFGIGSLFRANNNHQMDLFSSRGPTADGRIDPNIVAPGFAIFAQGADSSLSVVSGTSFASPMVAGAAALLLSAYPSATPDQIRSALLHSANPLLLEDNSGPLDHGFGFLDVLAAKTALETGAANPSDEGIDKKKVEQNIGQGTGVKVTSANNFIANTGNLFPGQRAEYFYEIKKTVKRVIITIYNVTPELEPADQNPLFGDDLLVAIHSAKTSSVFDYRALGFVGVEGATVVLEGSDLDVGIARITICGDWTNAGNISADVSVVQEHLGDEQGFHAHSRIAQGDSMVFQVNVPADANELRLRLVWDHDWGMYPTNDLDIFVFDPAFNLILLDNDSDNDVDGLSLDAPERLNIVSPAAGTWTILVDGFTVWGDTAEKFELFADIIK